MRISFIWKQKHNVVRTETGQHTNRRQEQHHKRPREEPPPSLNTDQRFSPHLPHPAGWPRRSQRGR